MRAEHIEFIVEEQSMEYFLLALLPKILGVETTFTIHAHQGKLDLLDKLGSRLRGYSKWLPESFRVIVLVDRDDDDCIALKLKMENEAAAAGLSTRTISHTRWSIVNRIVIEELEAWFFGAWASVKVAYPKVSSTVPNQSHYRDCDVISGGTWESFERVLKKAGYFSGGLRKVEAANRIGHKFDHTTCRSKSFIQFRDVIYEAIQELH